MAAENRAKRNSRVHDIILLINSCAGETSVQGLPHVVKAKNKLRKLTWLLVTLLLAGLWLWHSCSTVAKYLKFDVNIRTETVTSRQLPNPAVTVCNKNAYDGIKARQFIDNMAVHTRYALENGFQNASQYGPTWFPSWLDALAKNRNIVKFRSNGQLLQMFAEFTDNHGKTYGLTYRNFTIDYDKFVQRCWYEKEPCSTKGVHHKHIFNWLYGDCFTFFIDQNATGTGPRFGLQLTLFIDQKRYSEMTTDAGVQVVVHPPGQMPFPDEDGISVPPGHAAFVGIRMSETERLGGGNYGPCVDEAQQTDTLDYFNSSYSLRTCERSCFQQRLMEKCQCLDNRYPPYIIAQNITNYNNCITHFLSSFNFSNGLPDSFGCKDEVERMFNKFELGCNGVCHIPCHNTKYEATVSYSSWPSDNAMNETRQHILTKEVHDISDEEFRKNFLDVTVFFQTLNFELTKETPAFSIPEMLSDLGGNLGLYIGASLFTFFELSQLLFDIMFWCCRKTKSRDATNIKTDQHEKEFYQI